MFHTFSASQTDLGKGSLPSPQQEASNPLATARPAARGKPRAVHKEAANPQVQQTLTVCTRCRQRKIKCDPGLPRCNPCEKANSQCEYFDVTKRTVVSRKYVVWLQYKIQELETEMAKLDAEDREMDSELAVRNPGLVRLKESEETKFLGPSSGIAIARVVMNLAKKFTDSKSIKDIISDARMQEVEARFAVEETQKIPGRPPVPMHSEAPAVELPSRDLTLSLVELFFTKVHAMYPILHEPSFRIDVDDVYRGSDDAFQNFALRMVISVGLQRMDKTFTALADAYYLAALKYLERLVLEKSLRTLQGYALVAAYSLSTPTRTAIYYVIGAAVRLAQALGFTNEHTVGLDAHGGRVDPLELDMRRRLAWSIIVMDYGLAHSLGRPASMSVQHDGIQLNWFEVIDDEYITRQGILQAPGPSIRKWIARHFFKMRLLQLEIRKKLYQKKRAQPKDDSHPWFREMEQKLARWRDDSPLEEAGGTGLDKAWFMGRYYTMVVFLHRPSPQVPKPSIGAARKCYEACQFNVQMHQEQIKKKNVEVTWIWTQSVFMVINTLLWTLSYSDIRKEHTREEVRSNLDIGLECIKCSADRWPGSASAYVLYESLIDAVLRIYEKDGDGSVTHQSTSTSPETARQTASQQPGNQDRFDQTSPLQGPVTSTETPFGYIEPGDLHNATHAAYQDSSSPITPPLGSFAPAPSSLVGTLSQIDASNQSFAQSSSGNPAMTIAMPPTPASSLITQPGQTSRGTSQSPGVFESLHYFHPEAVEQLTQLSYDPRSAYNPLPTTFAELSNWTPNFTYPTVSPNFLPADPFAAGAASTTSPTSETPFGTATAPDYVTSPNFDPNMPRTMPSMQQQVAAPGSHLQQYLGQQTHEQMQSLQHNAGPMQQQSQFGDAYPDPYWTSEMLTSSVVGGFNSNGQAAMMGSGLPLEQQAILMQDLETIGPEQIEQMIAETNAMYNPPGATMANR